jgi:DNA-binding transcriptional LysR family regulator
MMAVTAGSLCRILAVSLLTALAISAFSDGALRTLWFASKRLGWNRDEQLPLAMLAPPCGVRALAVRALDKAGIAWSEGFVGGGVTAVAAAALAGLAVAPLAKRIAPAGLIDVGPALGLPRLGSSKVMLHSKVSDPAKLAALRTLAATFRSVVAAA